MHDDHNIPSDDDEDDEAMDDDESTSKWKLNLRYGIPSSQEKTMIDQ